MTGKKDFPAGQVNLCTLTLVYWVSELLFFKLKKSMLEQFTVRQTIFSQGLHQWNKINSNVRANNVYLKLLNNKL